MPAYSYLPSHYTYNRVLYFYRLRGEKRQYLMVLDRCYSAFNVLIRYGVLLSSDFYFRYLWGVSKKLIPEHYSTERIYTVQYSLAC